MTYRQLALILNKLSDDQLDCDIAIEVDGDQEYDTTIVPGELRIPTEEHAHDLGLDIRHPVIYIRHTTEWHEQPRYTDKSLQDYIDSLKL